MSKLTKQSEYLKTLREITFKKAEAADAVVGKPGADTTPVAVSDKTETVDQNAVKPENNTPQNAVQEPATKTEAKAPAENAKEAAADVEKIAQAVAAYTLGTEVAKGLIAGMNKAAAATTPEVVSPNYKEAGRRDFEQLITTAAAQLQAQKKTESTEVVKSAAELEQIGASVFDSVFAQEKQAEAAGAELFDKVAMFAKLAEMEEKIKELEEGKKHEASEPKKEEAKEEAKKEESAEKEASEKLAEKVAALVLKALKNTPVE